MKVFLGGTCNNSQWREALKPMLTLDYFDPVVDDWNEAAQQRELHERQTCDYVLYTITPKMTGVYSIAEIVDDSNKRPSQTVLCLLDMDDGLAFSPAQYRSLQAVASLVFRNGARVYARLKDVAAFLNYEDTLHHATHEES